MLPDRDSENGEPNDYSRSNGVYIFCLAEPHSRKLGHRPASGVTHVL